MSVFIAELNHQPVVAAHTLRPPEQNRLTRAMLTVEESGHMMPVFSAAGWAIHAASPDLSVSEVAETIAKIAPKEDVHVIEETDEAVVRAEMVKYLGTDLIERAFEPAICVDKAVAAPDVLHAR